MKQIKEMFKQLINTRYLIPVLVGLLIPFTISFVHNVERSIGNTVDSGRLDITVSSLQDDFVLVQESPTIVFTRDLTVDYVGTIPAKYRAEYLYIDGNPDLCSTLDFTVTLNGSGIKYQGKLIDFADFDTNQPEHDPNLSTVWGTQHDFNLQMSISADVAQNYLDETCEFAIKVTAWQSSMPDAGFGFWDEEIVNNLITVEDLPPSTPTGLHIIGHLGDDLGCGGLTDNRLITVDWDDNLEPDFDHYIYQNREETVIAQPIVSEFSGMIRNANGEYKYRAKAVDRGGNESDWTGWCHVTLEMNN